MSDFYAGKLAVIKFRRGDGYAVRPDREAADGQMVLVSDCFEMEEGGHSKYIGETCWYVDNWSKGLPTYVSERDLVWAQVAPSSPPIYERD